MSVGSVSPYVCCLATGNVTVFLHVVLFVSCDWWPPATLQHGGPSSLCVSSQFEEDSLSVCVCVCVCVEFVLLVLKGFTWFIVPSPTPPTPTGDALARGIMFTRASDFGRIGHGFDLNLTHRLLWWSEIDFIVGAVDSSECGRQEWCSLRCPLIYLNRSVLMSDIFKTCVLCSAQLSAV